MPPAEHPVAADGKVVTIRYRLTNDDGIVLDESDPGSPLPYLHGSGNIVAGLEREISGRKVGDEFEVHVAPGDGYGERDEAKCSQLPRSAFPDDIELEEGLQLVAQTEDDEPFPIWITEIDGDQITVDGNHPLAGETLHFVIGIEGVREATDEEREHGHVHGPGGHHHH